MLCESCKSNPDIRQLFMGKWVCMDCYLSMKARRDKKYYARLRLYCRINDIRRNRHD